MKMLEDREFTSSVLIIEGLIRTKFDQVTRGDRLSDVNSAFIQLGRAATTINSNPNAEDRSQAIEKFKELVKGIENKFLFEQDLKSCLDKDKAGLIKAIRGEGSHMGSGPSHFAVMIPALNTSLEAIHKVLTEASNQPKPSLNPQT